jgi:hypothetical protein
VDPGDLGQAPGQAPYRIGGGRLVDPLQSRSVVIEDVEQ